MSEEEQDMPCIFDTYSEKELERADYIRDEMKDRELEKAFKESELNALFDLDSVKMDSPRLKLLKEHDIQSHHSDISEYPWCALPMILAREVFKKHDESGDFNTIADITASVGSLLDDMGMFMTGDSQREVEDMALEYAIKHQKEDSK